MKTNAILIFCLVVLSGCGDGKTSITKKAGVSIGENLTEFGKSVGEGVDNKLLVKTTLTQEVNSLGLTHTTSKSIGFDSSKKGFTIYLIAGQKVDAPLMAKALNSDGAEIGRSKLPVKLGKDDAAYFTFEFDEQMDRTAVKEYVIGVKP